MEWSGEHTCLVQAEGVAAQHQSELEQALRTNHATQLDQQKSTSRSGLLSPGLCSGGSKLVISDYLHTNGPTTLTQRETYMRSICDF